MDQASIFIFAPPRTRNDATGLVASWQHRLTLLESHHRFRDQMFADWAMGARRACPDEYQKSKFITGLKHDRSFPFTEHILGTAEILGLAGFPKSQLGIPRPLKMWSKDTVTLPKQLFLTRLRPGRTLNPCITGWPARCRF